MRFVLQESDHPILDDVSARYTKHVCQRPDKTKRAGHERGIGKIDAVAEDWRGRRFEIVQLVRGQYLQPNASSTPQFDYRLHGGECRVTLKRVYPSSI